MTKFFAIVLATAAFAFLAVAPATAVENVFLLKGKTTVTVYYKDGRVIKKNIFSPGTYKGRHVWILRVGAPVKKVCIGSLCNTQDGLRKNMIFK